MQFRPIERSSGAFQESASADEIRQVCSRAFGSATEPVSVVELAGGLYNNTYRVDLLGRQPMILRIARADTDRLTGWMRMSSGCWE